MPYSTIQQISDALDLHTVQITAAQSDADYAQTEAARALSEIYTTGLDARVYTNSEIQKLKDDLRTEFQQADNAMQTVVLNALNGQITSALPGLLNDYYGPYSGMQVLYDALVNRFDQSDAALDNLLNTVFPGLQTNVNTVSTLANQVATDFTALQDSLKSVLVVYAINAAGDDQSLEAGSREYVKYVEYNGDPPTLPVSGTFIKFVGTPQSVWPIYASDASGNNQSFEPLGRDYVTFYESILVPELPVSGQTWVKYVGSSGEDGERGPGIWWISVATLPANSTEAQDAWNAATEITDGPKLRDQAWFYTGPRSAPTAQKVYICQTVTDDTTHTWDHQEHVLRGDLLVSGSVTSQEIDAKGLSIFDEAGNVVLSATGGSAGLDWSKVLGPGKPADNANYITSTSQIADGAGLGSTAVWSNISGSGKPANNADVTSQNTAQGIVNQGNFATLDRITSANATTYIANAAIANAMIGSLDAGKITTGLLNALRINIDGITLSRSGSSLIINNGGVNTDQLVNGSVTGRDSTTDLGTRNINTTNPTDLMSPSQYTLVDSGAQIADAVIFFQFSFNRNTGTDKHFFRMVRGSTVMQVWDLDEFQKDRTSGTISGLYIDHNHGSGSKSYFLQGYRDAVTSVGCNWSGITVMGAAWRR